MTAQHFCVSLFYFLLIYVETLAQSGTTTFKCTAPGYFADPTNCRRYYQCDENLAATQGTCTDFGYFDPVDICAMGDCTNPTNPPPTTPSRFRCTSQGYFADPEECHDYYFCDESLIAMPGTCTRFGHFDSNDICALGDCVNPTSPPPEPADAFKCTAEGYFADPKDCHGYYSCDATLKPTKSTCTAMGYFDELLQECQIGPCPTVPPETTVFSTMLSTTQTTKIVPPETTVFSTTLSTTQTTEIYPTPSTPTPFTCTKAGNFADPANCKAYYICNDILAMSHGVCFGGGGHFDSKTGGCVRGAC